MAGNFIGRQRFSATWQTNNSYYKWSTKWTWCRWYINSNTIRYQIWKKKKTFPSYLIVSTFIIFIYLYVIFKAWNRLEFEGQYYIHFAKSKIYKKNICFVIENLLESSASADNASLLVFVRLHCFMKPITSFIIITITAAAGRTVTITRRILINTTTSVQLHSIFKSRWVCK